MDPNTDPTLQLLRKVERQVHALMGANDGADASVVSTGLLFALLPYLSSNDRQAVELLRECLEDVSRTVERVSQERQKVARGQIWYGGQK